LYLDDKQMGKAYLIATDDWKAVPGMQTGGIDILSPEFTRERFVSLLKHRKDQVRVFLLDKKALDSLGNAYADEVLFEAGIHPKTFCRSLDHEQAVKLHDAIVGVMKEAVAEVARRDEPIEVKVRDFLKVRMKEVCPRCGSKIRKAGVRGMDAYFCPRCQPASRAGFVDWTRTGKREMRGRVTPPAGSVDAVQAFQLVSESLPEPLVLVTEEGVVLAANATAARLLGREQAALPGVALRDLVADPPIRLEGFLGACARSLRM